MTRRVGACAVFALLSTTSCVQILGIDAWGAGGAGSAGVTTTSTSTGSTPSKCAATTEFCLHPPAGWNGIVALTTQDGPCGGAFASEVSVGNTDLVGDAPTCDCTCDPPTGQACGKATLTLFNDGSCTTAIAPSYSVDACQSLGGAALNALSAKMTLPTVTQGSCVPTLTATIPPPQLDTRHVCELTQASARCDGDAGTCAPVPDGALAPQLCIWAESDRPCPGQEFSNKVVVYRGPVVDDRGCAACGCMPPTLASCSATMSVFTSTTCSNLTATPGTTCTPIAATSAGSASAAIVLTPSPCDVVPSMPTGALTASDPITVCCTNPLP